MENTKNQNNSKRIKEQGPPPKPIRVRKAIVLSQFCKASVSCESTPGRSSAPAKLRRKTVTFTPRWPKSNSLKPAGSVGLKRLGGVAAGSSCSKGRCPFLRRPNSLAPAHSSFSFEKKILYNRNDNPMATLSAVGGCLQVYMYTILKYISFS